MISADLYIDASVNDTRKNGKCVALVIMDENEEEYLWAQHISHDMLLELWPYKTPVTKLSIGSAAYETYSLFGFTQYLIDKQITGITFVCYTDNQSLYKVFNRLGEFKKINKRIYESLLVNINILKRKNVTFDVRWIKSHSNVYGNTKVDHFTRKTPATSNPIKPISVF
jgi:hypothetical protein